MAENNFNSLINKIIWVFLLIFVIPILLLLWIYKKFLERYVTFLYGNNFRPPNEMFDSVMCQGTSYERPGTNVAHVWVVEGPWITAQEFSNHFRKCFLEETSEKYRNLYAHVTTYGSYSFFAHCKPEELDLRWHIREYSIGDYGQGTVESWAITWMTANTYEEGRPAWQIAILHLGNSESGTLETVIVAKFSHAIVDGYSFIHMIGKLTDNPAPYLVKDRIFTWKDKIKYIYTAPRELFACYGNQAFSKDSQNPFKKDALSKDKQWFMSFATLDLASFKAIRKATDTNFACLMIAAQFGAWRKLMLEKMKERELPEYMWMANSLPWPNHPHSFTNHWTLGFYKCQTRIADPIQRLQSIDTYYRDFTKNEYEIKGQYTLGFIFRTLPTRWRNIFFRHDLAVRNVPSFFASLMLSSEKHYLLGRAVKKLYLPVALPDVFPFVLSGVTSSHSGQIDLAITANSVAVKNQKELDRLTQVYFLEELDIIASRYGLSLECPTSMRTKKVAASQG